MDKPEDIPLDVYVEAAAWVVLMPTFRSEDETGKAIDIVARAILKAKEQAYEEQESISNDMIIAVAQRAADFGITLHDWQANALVCAANGARKK